MTHDKLELLSPGLIEEYPNTAAEIDHLCRCLWKEIGWHYILDLVWVLETLDRMDIPKGATIIDAGAGTGILQFLLANRGYNVLSVDFSPYRKPLIPSLAFSIGRIEGKSIEHDYIKHITKVGSFQSKLSRLWNKVLQERFAMLSLLAMSAGRLFGYRRPGRITFYRADMRSMDSVESGSIDAVVSVSAVEHMEINNIQDVVKEFARVLKPGASMVLTTSAARDRDWFHEPSKGWCFSESSLKKLFTLSQTNSFDVTEYDKLMELFRESKELKRRLASLYFTSGDNGMPWGKWNPEYLPVGILKIFGEEKHGY